MLTKIRWLLEVEMRMAHALSEKEWATLPMSLILALLQVNILPSTKEIRSKATPRQIARVIPCGSSPEEIDREGHIQ